MENDRSLNPLRTKLIIFAGIALLVAFGAFIWREPPSGLHIHVQSIRWKSIVIESDNLPQPIHIQSPGSGQPVSPLAHGIYHLRIQLSDGRIVWSSFLHHDAGIRRRVDLFISPSTRPGYIRFRQTANRFDELFSGETQPEDTTEDLPFQLDWI